MENRVTGISEDAQHYLELADRCLELRRNSTPSSFIQWAHRVGLAFHEDWHKAVKAPGTARENPAAIGADQRRERLIRRWARYSYWSPAEGAALAYNFEPEVAVIPAVGESDNPSIRGTADAIRLLNLAYRAVGLNDLTEKATPVVFLKWSRSTGVEFHPDWWDAVTDDSASAEEAKAPAPVRDLTVREQESLLKMVVGMAIGAYRWDPNAARSSVTTEITDDLMRADVALDADTVRKWLRKGAELLRDKGP